MKSGDVFLLVMLQGLGGAVIYLLWKQNQPNPVPTSVIDKSGGQCGASYLGVGASVPCNLLGAAAKSVYNDVKPYAAPVINNLKTATSGIKTWEYVVTPVAITHATYNEAKSLLSSINPF